MSLELLDKLHKSFSPREIELTTFDDAAFPELRVRVPDEWPSISLAPLYDVHKGHKYHDAELFRRHVAWIRRTPTVLTFLGGDLLDNSSKFSVGTGVYEQDLTPDEQLYAAIESVAPIQHKILFSIPGNHEHRTLLMGIDLGRAIATMLKIPYFPDYVMCAIEWRGNRFRVLAHHGSGSAQTAGAQRMAARKDLAWAKPFDLFMTGHLHSPLVDVLYQTDQDQRTGRIVERNGLIVVAPSYLGYFGTYAATRRYPPGTRGLAVVVLNEDGRIDASVHARGTRL